MLTQIHMCMPETHTDTIMGTNAHVQAGRNPGQERQDDLEGNRASLRDSASSPEKQESIFLHEVTF